MTSIISRVLRRSSLLVRGVRTLRKARWEWNQAAIDLQQENKCAKRLTARQNAISAYLSTHPLVKLNIGAGIYPLVGWLNSDIEPVDRETIYLDARDQFPFEDEIVDYVSAEHMIEHVHYPEALRMLAEIGRVLKPGGKVRLATPDLQAIVKLLYRNKDRIAREYIKTYACELLGLYSPEPNRFQRHEPQWNINYKHVHTYFPDVYRDPASFVVNLIFYGFGHRFIYDLSTIKAVLLQNNFYGVTSHRPGESEDGNLRGIERHGLRFGNESINVFETMVVEAFH